MSSRKRIALLAGVAAIAALMVASASMAGLLDLFTGSQPPVHSRVRMSSSGFELRQDFRIKKYCAYNFDLRLLHTQNRMGELDSVLVGRMLPASVKLDVYRLNGERVDRVAQLSGYPQEKGRSPGMTTLGIGNVKLDEGRYRLEITSAGDAPRLAGIEADFVVQPTPKTNCPKK